MKFHKNRVKTQPTVEGFDNYIKLSNENKLALVPVRLCSDFESLNFWRKVPVETVEIIDQRLPEPLEISKVIFQPREPIVDELTRHQSTFQIFLPITGSISAVVTKSTTTGHPDRDSAIMVNVSPGEAFIVERGTWHTLPFSFHQKCVGLSIMYRDTLENYHDVRDLVVEGWVGVLTWDNPE